MSSLSFDCNVTGLENLPNELLRMIFRYLTTFDIYHSFYALNTGLNSLIKNEQLYFQLTDKLPVKQAVFAVEQILPNLGENKLQLVEINLNTVFWSFIKLHSSISCTSLHTIRFKNLTNLPFAPVISLLQQSSQLKHFRVQIESNKDPSWFDGGKWDAIIEHHCPHIQTIYATISNLPSLHLNSNPKLNPVTKTFQSFRWKQGHYRIYYLSQINNANLLITQSQLN